MSVVTLDVKTFVQIIRLQLFPVVMAGRGSPALLRASNPCYKKEILNKSNSTKSQFSSLHNFFKEDPEIQLKISVFFILISTVLLIFYIWLILYCREDQYSKRGDERYGHEIVELDEISKGNVKDKDENDKEYITDKYEIKREMLTLLEVLGKGEFGIVSKGLLKTTSKHMEVAVKTLKETATIDDQKRFDEEVELMITLGNHQHLVSLIGFCKVEKLLVVEFCSLGDLKEFLRTTRITKMKGQSYIFKKPKEGAILATNELYFQTDLQQKQILLNVIDLLTFAKQIALGMEYLASNRVIHRDLAARNILLTSNLITKISDFGLSRDIYGEEVYRKKSKTRLPIKWMAIEALAYDIFTTQSDVWAFGILFWEIMTLGGVPYPTVPSKDILILLKRGIRLDKPPSCTTEIYELMCSCWDVQPNKRPSFSEIVVLLSDFISRETKLAYSEQDATHCFIDDYWHEYDLI